MPITFGGSTDEWVKFDARDSFNDLSLKSMFFWMQPSVDSTSNERLLWKTVAGDFGGWSIALVIDDNFISLNQRSTGGTAVWSITDAGVIIKNGLFSVGISMDLGDINNNTPEFYLNGQPIINTEEVPPSGSWESDGDDGIYVGNSRLGTNPYHGLIDKPLLFNRILTPTEFGALHNSVLLLPDLVGLVFAPLFLGADGKASFTGTLSNSNFVYDYISGSKGTPSESPVASQEILRAFPFANG